MKTISHDELVARVVAWHNRHPLARRITAAQVQGVGVVVLPFIAPGWATPAPPQPPTEATGATLRERALAETQAGVGAVVGNAVVAALPQPVPSKAQRHRWRAAFSEDFIAPLKPRRVARFARGHAGLESPPASAWPRREVLVDAALLAGQDAPAWLYLHTAAVEVGSRRIRLLLSETAPGLAIGPRLWSAQRAWGAGLTAVALLAAALGATQGHFPNKPGPETMLAAALPDAASAPPPAIARLPEPVPEPVPQQAPPPEPDEPTTAPATAPTTAPTTWPVNIRPQIDAETARAARRDAASWRAMDAAASSTPRPPAGGHYALVARSTKSRAASEVLLGFMKTAAIEEGKAAQRQEVLPAQNGWRATLWPFATAQDAQLARELLAARGVDVDVVSF